LWKGNNLSDIQVNPVEKPSWPFIERKRSIEVLLTSAFMAEGCFFLASDEGLRKWKNAGLRLSEFNPVPAGRKASLKH